MELSIQPAGELADSTLLCRAVQGHEASMLARQAKENSLRVGIHHLLTLLSAGGCLVS